mmetsp:Transcript_2400/g.2683  ORF Transcript_2400/g.2683 Transcript_2400/m.2683 type:complete len:264 (+) Transcript_2400:45-836(+)
MAILHQRLILVYVILLFQTKAVSGLVPELIPPSFSFTNFTFTGTLYTACDGFEDISGHVGFEQLSSGKKNTAVYIDQDCGGYQNWYFEDPDGNSCDMWTDTGSQCYGYTTTSCDLESHNCVLCAEWLESEGNWTQSCKAYYNGDEVSKETIVQGTDTITLLVQNTWMNGVKSSMVLNVETWSTVPPALDQFEVPSNCYFQDSTKRTLNNETHTRHGHKHHGRKHHNHKHHKHHKHHHKHHHHTGGKTCRCMPLLWPDKGCCMT